MIRLCILLPAVLFLLLSSFFWLPIIFIAAPFLLLSLILLYALLKVFGVWGKFMRLIYEIYDWLMFKSDKPRKYFWRRFYSFLCWKFPQKFWKTMNCGYGTESGQTISLKPDYDQEKFSYQLYHFISTGFNKIENYHGKQVIDIGCGRGGGLAFIMDYLQPESALGVDFSKYNIGFCKRNYSVKGLSFCKADAEKMQVKDEFADFVICVESSHCFGNFKNFLHEAQRILKPQGQFFLCDFIASTERNEYEESFKDMFELVSKQDITEAVLISLRRDSQRKIKLIKRYVPFVLRSAFKRFAVIEGSTLYNQLEAGDTVYMAYHFKPLIL